MEAIPPPSQGNELLVLGDSEKPEDVRACVVAIQSINHNAFSNGIPEIIVQYALLPLATLSRVLQNPSEFQNLSEDLRGHIEFARAAIGKMGAMTEFTSEELQDNGEIAHLAITNDPAAFQYLSQRLRSNRTRARFAVSQNGTVVAYATGGLQLNREMQDLATRQRMHMLNPYQVQVIQGEYFNQQTDGSLDRADAQWRAPVEPNPIAEPVSASPISAPPVQEYPEFESTTWEKNWDRFYAFHETDECSMTALKIVIWFFSFATLGLLPLLIYLGSETWDWYQGRNVEIIQNN